jgi:Saposin A-type domain
MSNQKLFHRNHIRFTGFQSIYPFHRLHNPAQQQQQSRKTFQKVTIIHSEKQNSSWKNFKFTQKIVTKVWTPSRTTKIGVQWSSISWPLLAWLAVSWPKFGNKICALCLHHHRRLSNCDLSLYKIKIWNFSLIFPIFIAVSVILASPLSQTAAKPALLGAKECTWGPSYWCSNITWVIEAKIPFP